MSLFEIKHPLPFDVDRFEKMYRAAKDALKKAVVEANTQVIVLWSAKGSIYSEVITNALTKDQKEETVLLDRLRAARDTEICRVLCMWYDGEIDIPSFAFRERLVEINPSNRTAGVFVRTREGDSVIQLAGTV